MAKGNQSVVSSVSNVLGNVFGQADQGVNFLGEALGDLVDRTGMIFTGTPWWSGMDRANEMLAEDAAYRERVGADPITPAQRKELITASFTNPRHERIASKLPTGYYAPDGSVNWSSYLSDPNETYTKPEMVFGAMSMIPGLGTLSQGIRAVRGANAINNAIRRPVVEAALDVGNAISKLSKGSQQVLKNNPTQAAKFPRIYTKVNNAMNTFDDAQAVKAALPDVTARNLWLSQSHPIINNAAFGSVSGDLLDLIYNAAIGGTPEGVEIATPEDIANMYAAAAGAGVPTPGSTFSFDPNAKLSDVLTGNAVPPPVDPAVYAAIDDAALAQADYAASQGDVAEQLAKAKIASELGLAPQEASAYQGMQDSQQQAANLLRMHADAIGATRDQESFIRDREEYIDSLRKRGQDYEDSIWANLFHFLTLPWQIKAGKNPVNVWANNKANYVEGDSIAKAALGNLVDMQSLAPSSYSKMNSQAELLQAAASGDTKAMQTALKSVADRREGTNRLLKAVAESQSAQPRARAESASARAEGQLTKEKVRRQADMLNNAGIRTDIAGLSALDRDAKTQAELAGKYGERMALEDIQSGKISYTQYAAAINKYAAEFLRGGSGQVGDGNTPPATNTASRVRAAIEKNRAK